MGIKIIASGLILFATLLFSINSHAEVMYWDEFDDSTREPYFDDLEPNGRVVTLYSSDEYNKQRSSKQSFNRSKGVSKQIYAKKDRVIIINPRNHTWAAYSNGRLLRSGKASAGANWCHDLGRPCRTKVGTFRIYSLGSSECFSRKFPLGEGGAPMPYCMYFNGGQGLHGSNEVYGNRSHGCVRVSVSDARWIRYNFATVGTKVIIKPY